MQGERHCRLTVSVSDQADAQCGRAARFDIPTRQQAFQMPGRIVPLNFMADVLRHGLDDLFAAEPDQSQAQRIAPISIHLNALIQSIYLCQILQLDNLAFDFERRCYKPVLNGERFG